MTPASLLEKIDEFREYAEDDWWDRNFPEHHFVFKTRDLWAEAHGLRTIGSEDEHRRMIGPEFDQYARGKCGWQVATYPSHEYCGKGVRYRVVGSFYERSHCREHLEEINNY